MVRYFLSEEGRRKFQIRAYFDQRHGGKELG